MSPRTRAKKQLDPIEQAMEKALAPGSFISYKAAWAFVDKVQAVANGLEKIIAHMYRSKKRLGEALSRVERGLEIARSNSQRPFADHELGETKTGGPIFWAPIPSIHTGPMTLACFDW